MGITRRDIRKQYESCSQCPENITGYGLCGSGYENFYRRYGKNNDCPKCQKEIQFWHLLKGGKS